MAILIVLSVAGCRNGEHAHAEDTYICPMHPTVVSNKPGACPVCGMDLVKKNTAAGNDDVAVGTLAEEPNEVIHANLITTSAKVGKRPMSIEAQGVVTYDTRFVYTIPARTGGRLEKAYTKFTYQPIRKGDRVAEIYSPELATAQREYLYLLGTGDTLLLQGAARKLNILGFTDAQLNRLKTQKEVNYTVSVFSPYSGYVLSSDATAPAATNTTVAGGSGGGGMGMGSAGPSPTASGGAAAGVAVNGELLQEGQYVQTGQALLKVVSSQALRIELNLPAAYTSLIQKGEAVDLNFGNGHAHKATIDFVEPFFAEGQEFLKVRVYTSNMENMHIGHLVDARIAVMSPEVLWIKKSSVVNLGVDQVVFISDGKVFRPRRISTGMETDGWVEVRQNLTIDDRVALNASYLVDSESFIQLNKESK